ncbi:MAG: L-threonylcarbamoyladenylate synthase [Acidimicrobiales bacterium]
MIVPTDEAFSMTMAALRRGAVVVIPTDTVYGLAARADDADAMARLFALKSRDGAKSIAVLVADLGQARSLTTHGLDRFAPFWPGPLTVVVPRAAGAVLHLGTDESTVGIRCPDDAFVRRLALEVGPIAATSANEAGEPTPATAREIAEIFASVALVVDGGPRHGVASTVIDATVDPPVLLRAGSLPPSALGL